MKQHTVGKFIQKVSFYKIATQLFCLLDTKYVKMARWRF